MNCQCYGKIHEGEETSPTPKDSDGVDKNSGGAKG